MIAGLHRYRGTVSSVYDGDTCTAELDLGFGVWRRKVKIRLAGIDTPELRGGTPETKARARAARDRLAELVQWKDVLVHSTRLDKYGRSLAELWVVENGELVQPSVNQVLLQEGHGRPYSGGKRSS